MVFFRHCIERGNKASENEWKSQHLKKRPVTRSLETWDLSTLQSEIVYFFKRTQRTRSTGVFTVFNYFVGKLWPWTLLRWCRFSTHARPLVPCSKTIICLPWFQSITRVLFPFLKCSMSTCAFWPFSAMYPLDLTRTVQLSLSCREATNQLTRQEETGYCRTHQSPPDKFQRKNRRWVKAWKCIYCPCLASQRWNMDVRKKNR